MRKVLLSLLTIGGVAALAIAGTQAFFNDTETSTDNTFQAGALDLKVDSQCHYYHFAGLSVPGSIQTGDLAGYVDIGCPTSVDTDDDGPELPFTVGTWEQTDLGTHKFFWFDDVKPGDRGEDTISLHVYNNDAWGRFTVSEVTDLDNSCEEPEGGDELGGPGNTVGCTSPDGELAESLVFSAWLDQGTTAGFQCVDANGDPVPDCSDGEEGDNILNGIETEFWTDELANIGSWNIWELLSAEYTARGCNDVDGNTNYGLCHGLAADGRMVGSTTYFFGLAWELPNTVDNKVQTDSLSADMSFEVVQHRNNPAKTF